MIWVLSSVSGVLIANINMLLVHDEASALSNFYCTPAALRPDRCPKELSIWNTD
jgi:hypothetical protein